MPTGLPANPEIARLVGKLKRTLRERGQEARWTPADLWHVTVHFIGRTDVAPEEIARRLGDLSEFEYLQLRFHGMGAFPAPDRARVLWLGVQETQELTRFQNQVGSRLRDLKSESEEREFIPHLTLARFRNAISVKSLIEVGGRRHFGDYPAGELLLFESVLQGNILRYLVRSRLDLTCRP